MGYPASSQQRTKEDRSWFTVISNSAGHILLLDSMGNQYFRYLQTYQVGVMILEQLTTSSDCEFSLTHSHSHHALSLDCDLGSCIRFRRYNSDQVW